MSGDRTESAFIDAGLGYDTYHAAGLAGVLTLRAGHAAFEPGPGSAGPTPWSHMLIGFERFLLGAGNDTIFGAGEAGTALTSVDALSGDDLFQGNLAGNGEGAGSPWEPATTPSSSTGKRWWPAGPAPTSSSGRTGTTV